MKRSVVIVGAGISGLSVGYEITQRAKRLGFPVEVSWFEASGRTGGHLATDQIQGYTVEWGANGFLDNADCTVTLVRRLGLAADQIQARQEAAIRYIYRAGKLRRVPSGPVDFLRSDVVTLSAKLRMLAEPWIPRHRGPHAASETIAEFARRRLGKEAASVLVDAMVSGVFAGDAEHLSLGATFPTLKQMEAEHGSLFRGLRAASAQGDKSATRSRLTSFRGGMQQLVDRLTEATASEFGQLHLNRPIGAISNLGVRGFRVHPAEGPPFDVDAVVLACPSAQASQLVEAMDPPLSRAMADIPSASLAVVHHGVRRDALGSPPEGFGFLVPRGQGPRILGALWSSNIFEGRAPKGNLLISSMIGGAHDPEAVRLDDRALEKIVLDDLDTCMGMKVQPHFSQIYRHNVGIPQYTRDHPQRLALIEERVQRIPGFAICGNSYGGVSVNACIEAAPKVAERILNYLNLNTDAAVM